MPPESSRFRAAIRAAESEGKDCATRKHLDAVRGDYAPLKVATAETSTPTEKKKAEKPEKLKTPPDGREWTAQEIEDGEAVGEVDEQPTLETLGAPAEAVTPSKKQTATSRGALMTVIAKWGEDQAVAMSDEDMTALCDAIEEAAIPF